MSKPTVDSFTPRVCTTQCSASLSVARRRPHRPNRRRSTRYVGMSDRGGSLDFARIESNGTVKTFDECETSRCRDDARPAEVLELPAAS